MKTTFLFLMLISLSTITLAQKKNETSKPFVGTWKFSRQSAINDFQKAFENSQTLKATYEYLNFEANGKIKHLFVNNENVVIKTLEGKWKEQNGKIKITYNDFDINLSVDFFFLGDDLVLGQNFNHVIFSKENLIDNSITMK